MLQAFAAMLGSLFLSEFVNLPPCDLCWYQRICFYPLAAIFGVGLIRKDPRGAFWNALPLAALGWLIAFYQVLLQEGVFDEGGILPCSLNNPCAVKDLLFGFITIPQLSLIGFTVVLACLAVLWSTLRTPRARDAG